MRKGESVPDDDLPVRPTVQADLDDFLSMKGADLESWYLPQQQIKRCPSAPLSLEGVDECLVIGVANTNEGIPAAPIPHPHDFQVRRIRMETEACIPSHARREVEVIFVHAGSVEISMQSGGCVTLNKGDLVTLPIATYRSWRNTGDDANDIHVVRGGDFPDAPVWG